MTQADILILVNSTMALFNYNYQGIKLITNKTPNI
jgi:hypothetical protein